VNATRNDLNPVDRRLQLMALGQLSAAALRVETRDTKDIAGQRASATGSLASAVSLSV